LISTGVPRYGQGTFIQILSAGYIKDDKGQVVRLGIEILTGVSYKEGLSTANKNHISINGKVHKLGSVDVQDGFEPDE